MKKHAFNLKTYRTAMGVNRYLEPDTGSVIEGPDMAKLEMTLQERYPAVRWTADIVNAVKSWIDRHFTGNLPPIPDQVAKDLARRPLE